jgi:hypothetical protein
MSKILPGQRKGNIDRAGRKVWGLGFGVWVSLVINAFFGCGKPQAPTKLLIN